MTIRWSQQKVVAALAVAAFCILAAPVYAQNLSFDVVSVRPSAGGDQSVSSTVPLGPGDIFPPNGGNLTARGMPLLTYIAFAYRMNDVQLKAFRTQAPEWVTTERFDIQAKTENQNTTKNEMRLMMRALLADRFALTLHEETRESSVYELVLVKAGLTGPKLRLHPEVDACSKEPPKADESTGKKADDFATVDGGFPVICGGLLRLPSTEPGHIKLGGRDISLRLLADSLTGWGQLGRPVIDKTGLGGDVDFVLDYRFEGSADAPSSADETGPGFQDALKQQLGLKLEATKQPVKLQVLDHVARPTEN